MSIWTLRVMPWIVSSPIAVTATTAPSVAGSPRSTGSVRTKAAVGCWSVSRASCTLSSRRLSLVVTVVKSTSKAARDKVVPSNVTDPVTSPVRPTAVAEPILARVSLPTKLPVRGVVVESSGRGVHDPGPRHLGDGALATARFGLRSRRRRRGCSGVEAHRRRGVIVKEPIPAAPDHQHEGQDRGGGDRRASRSAQDRMAPPGEDAESVLWTC